MTGERFERKAGLSGQWKEICYLIDRIYEELIGWRSERNAALGLILIGYAASLTI